MSGDLTLFKPGDYVPAELVAGTGGAVPERGDGLEIAGNAQVQPTTGGGTFIGTLQDLPPEFDDPGDLAEGDVIGEVTVLVRHYIDWLQDPDGTVSAGDMVTHDADGVAVYDADPGTDTPDMIVGTVFTTASRAEGTADKVAVIRHGR